ncbi:MAG: HAMP domain-containing histidine kinase [Sulfurovum sp.]|nr:HAMP domain-containing histidine kinase [Sulfurovum sp.]
MDEKIQTKMQLCAYSKKCKYFKTDFVKEQENKEVNILYKDGDFYSYFKVPNSGKDLLKITYAQKRFFQRVERLEKKVLRKFLLYSILAALVSFLFAIYALLPLQKALRVNEEFVKDILHDFNTPISSMLINLKIFKREIGDNPKIKRLENNIQSILSLQDNLRVFLKGVPAQSQDFSLNNMVEKQVSYFNILYSDVNYKMNIDEITLTTNKDAFKRVMDNLLSNAGKYNIADGEVSIVSEGNNLLVKDTGKGIKHPSKVFERYYKEQDRGIGIGLHIVKKLCNELNIGIKIQSKEKKGTTINLDLSNVIG